MSDIKVKYPSTSSVAVTCDPSALASSTTGAGRASTAVDNTANLDLDHLVSGKLTTGTTPTAGKTLSVYAYAPHSIAAGTPTYPDTITGVDAAVALSNANVMVGELRLLWSCTIDATSNLAYYMPPTSIAQAFGGMPASWGLFVTHDTVAALNATAANHGFSYFRLQGQTV
jgi:hypothetical protein